MGLFYHFYYSVVLKVSALHGCLIFIQFYFCTVESSNYSSDTLPPRRKRGELLIHEGKLIRAKLWAKNNGRFFSWLHYGQSVFGIYVIKAICQEEKSSSHTGQSCKNMQPVYLLFPLLACQKSLHLSSSPSSSTVTLCPLNSRLCVVLAPESVNQHQICSARCKFVLRSHSASFISISCSDR